MKPRILMVCDRPGWAFDVCARNLAAQLANRFTIDICYVVNEPEIDQEAYDLIYLFWWGERHHRRFVTDRTKIVKEVSSHRWATEARYGNHAPLEAVERYMHDAEHLVVTSQRLQNLFNGIHPSVHQYHLGVDPKLFSLSGPKLGDMRVGWAGNKSDPSKGVTDILVPACGEMYQLMLSSGDLPHDRMPDFFNQLDVICVASVAEGTPLPLIEAMACGCFPIATDVGVASEIIKHGVNGLIVERTASAFRSALDWCRDNLDLVRAAGKKNAELIRQEWNWTVSASQFAVILDTILSNAEEMRQTSSVKKMDYSDGYADHFNRINTDSCSDSAYHAAVSYYFEDLEQLLPVNKTARIVEIGTGHGHFLRYLVEMGYERVSGVDMSSELMAMVRLKLAHRVEYLAVSEGGAFLVDHPGTFDCIVMLDMIEHVPLAEARNILMSARKSLKPDGRIIIRTPNMANLLGGYSLHMDLTHRHGYTEWSLIHLLDECGFMQPKIHVPSKFSSRSRKWRAWLVQKIHRQFYLLNDRVQPTWFGKNIVVAAEAGRKEG